ncbi:unnamed protein product [Kluyveromyces dobzhanskii CBS 2104]|uniref:WGS project CCBQ000000000 data, contig 00014 n=1 Tax=Kluyveromyces dobzhanskii CBS 2104 TaxID=1427455 RepID=A0A0A8L8Y0_9SACH|nr:unnamed protein product [Kluyveromyces dobzhanskii CBS 2104]
MAVRRFLSATRYSLPSIRSKPVLLSVFGTCIALLCYLLFFKSNLSLEDLKNAASSGYLTSQPTFSEIMSDVRIKPIDEVPVSPLELIPDIEIAMKKKYDQSWNFLSRGKKYRMFNDYDLNTRCEFYFHNLYNLKEDWTNNIRRFTFDINDLDTSSRLGNLMDEDGVQLADEKSLRLYKRTHNVALGMERLRLYDKCFVNNNGPNPVKMNNFFSKSKSITSKLDKEVMGKHISYATTRKNSFLNDLDSSSFQKYDQWDFEHRMFPMIPYFELHNFTSVMPIFTGPNSPEPLPQGKFPVLHRKTGEVIRLETFQYDSTKSLWANWNDMSSACAKRGIVLSAGDGQTDVVIRLIATLRAQGNRLPIQVIHNSQLSTDSVKRLSEAAKSKTFSSGPAQSIWFLDVSPTIEPSMKQNFDRFKNKWLSVMFNTFEQFVFIDSDAISYINLAEYFNFPEYKLTGTLLFKDRSLTFQTEQKCPALFETLEPRMLESYYFGTYPMINADHVEETCMSSLSPEEKVYKKFFEIGHQHNLESGLLAINKNKHIIGLAIATFLNISPKVGGCGWGDKEFFWLGLLVSGQQYSIYDVDASAVGVPEQKKFTEKGGPSDDYQICSLQVAHTSYENHLLWINGGSQYCKKPEAFEDDWKNIEGLRNSFSDDKEKAMDAYSDIVNIEAAIIPDTKGGDWGREDQRCKGYFWCGKFSTKVKPYTYNKVINKGKLIYFDEDELRYIEKINSIWNSAIAPSA